MGTEEREKGINYGVLKKNENNKTPSFSYTTGGKITKIDYFSLSFADCLEYFLGIFARRLNKMKISDNCENCK